MSIRLWNAVMKKGVIAFLPPWECIHRVSRDMNMKTFGQEYNNFSESDEEEVMK